MFSRPSYLSARLPRLLRAVAIEISSKAGGSVAVLILLITCGLLANVESLGAQSSAIVVTPPSVTLAPGTTQQFTATLNGAPIQVRWRASGGTITSSGLF